MLVHAVGHVDHLERGDACDLLAPARSIADLGGQILVATDQEGLLRLGVKQAAVLVGRDVGRLPVGRGGIPHMQQEGLITHTFVIGHQFDGANAGYVKGKLHNGIASRHDDYGVAFGGVGGGAQARDDQERHAKQACLFHKGIPGWL